MEPRLRLPTRGSRPAPEPIKPKPLLEDENFIWGVIVGVFGTIVVILVCALIYGFIGAVVSIFS